MATKPKAPVKKAASKTPDAVSEPQPGDQKDPAVVDRQEKPALKFDPSQPYGQVHGQAGGAVFYQNGHHFNASGDPVD